MRTIRHPRLNVLGRCGSSKLAWKECVWAREMYLAKEVRIHQEVERVTGIAGLGLWGGV
jgi:hypothetical protein